MQQNAANLCNLKLANKMAAHFVEMTSASWERTPLRFCGGATN